MAVIYNISTMRNVDTRIVINRAQTLFDLLPQSYDDKFFESLLNQRSIKFPTSLNGSDEPQNIRTLLATLKNDIINNDRRISEPIYNYSTAIGLTGQQEKDIYIIFIEQLESLLNHNNIPFPRFPDNQTTGGYKKRRSRKARKAKKLINTKKVYKGKFIRYRHRVRS